jgi:shikimate kinase
MKNLVLIGFMGSGKSTVGKIVSGELKMNFVDLDRWIEAREGISISEIFKHQWEDAFRELEAMAVKEIAQSNNQVIATGGGVVLRKSNLDLLMQTGILVHLRIDAKTAFARTQGHSHRPLLGDGDAAKRIEQLLEERQSLYDAIPNCVQSVGRSMREVVADVVRIYLANQK